MSNAMREIAHQTVKIVDYWIYRGGEDKVRDILTEVLTTIAAEARREGERNGIERAAAVADTYGEPDIRDAILSLTNTPEPTENSNGHNS